MPNERVHTRGSVLAPLSDPEVQPSEFSAPLELPRPLEPLRTLPDPDPPARHGRTRALSPYHLMWHERDVVVLGDGQYRVRVPVLGSCRSRTLAARLDTLLRSLWIGRMRSGGITITSIAVDAQEWNGATHLTMVITADSDQSTRIDTIAMARDLRLALHRISLQDACA